MRLLRQLFSLEPELIRVARAQNDIIRYLKDEALRQELEHRRYVRVLLEQFLAAVDNEDTDWIGLREVLVDAHCDISDEVARMEEMTAS